MEELAPDGTSEPGETLEPEDDSHAAIWAAMSTTVVRDNSQHATRHHGATGGRPLVVDDSDSDSDESSTSASDGDGWGGSAGGVAISSASTGPGVDAADPDDDGVALHDLFPGVGTTEHLDADLPSIADALRMLEDIAARRQAISAIASKYSPVQPGATSHAQAQTPPREIVTHMPARCIGAWIGAVSEAQAVDSAAVAQRSVVEGEQTLGVDSAVDSPCEDPRGKREKYIEFSQLDSKSIDLRGNQGECVQFSQLEAECSRTQMEPAESAEVEAIDSAGAKYAVQNDSGVTDAAVVGLGDNQSTSKASAQLCEHTTNPIIRPWTQAPGPALGPAAPHDSANAAAMLNRLGRRFRECDASTAQQRITETSDIIREIGARFGELGTSSCLARPLVGQSQGNAQASSDVRHSSQLKEGDTVILKGLSRPELNGKKATIVRASAKSLKPAPGRMCVRLDEEEPSSDAPGKLSIKIENLEKTSDVPQGSPEDSAPDGVEHTGAAAKGGTTGAAADGVHVDPFSFKPEARAGASAQAAWPFSEEQVAWGLRSDELKQAELWHRFLAGDDRPVGGDDLPTADVYYSGGATM